MNAIINLRKTLMIVLMASVCCIASARPRHYRMYRHHVRPATTVVVKQCGCTCKKHHKHHRRYKTIKRVAPVRSWR
ncbi:hypothetical protein [uncultured Prevotella sp.]|uniref:hypothetical protein n=1 Tax=uncultured Prevotella sp. TaxID=159272 RepID=UPI00260DEE61|nr:hypothetical protein [uncultured Prevotella sp.]